MAKAPEFAVSPSVVGAIGRFRAGEPVTSWEVARAILELHPEYAGMGARVSATPGPHGGEKRSADEWLGAVNQLFDPQKMDAAFGRVNPQKPPEIHGRLMILGLAEIDPELQKYLIGLGFYEPLLKESEPPFRGLLRGYDAADAEPEQPSPETPLPPPIEVLPTYEYTRALEQASAVAAQASRAPASVVLLAVLLHQGALDFLNAPQVPQYSATDPSLSFERPAALVARAIFQQRFPKDTISDLTGFYRELIGETAPSEVAVPSMTIPALLDLESDYGISEISANGSGVIASALGSANPNIAQTSDTELARIDQAARAFARQATPIGAPEPDHLLAVLLAPNRADLARAIQSRLLVRDCDLSVIRSVLLEAVKKSRPGDNLKAWEAALLAPDYVPPIAGYISDYVRGETIDRLDIESEVANIASVLTYKQVNPPLSLGLFGDWGSGKTFFMTHLCKAVERSTDYYLKQEQATGQSADWCSRVVQIDFNAWNYSDTNLWAGMVTRIFEALYAEFKDADAEDKAYKDKIEKEMTDAKGAVSQAAVQKELASQRVTQAHAALMQAQKERVEKENSLRGLISDLAKLLTGARKKELDRAADALGYPEAAESFEALQDLNTSLHSFSSRSSVLLLNTFRSHWTLLILALCVIVLPLAATLIIERLMPYLGIAGARVTEISVFLTGLFASLKFQIDRGMGWVRQVEEAYQEAAKIRQERLEEDGADDHVKQARDALVLAESQEQAAAANLQAAQAELQRLQTELAEFRPDQRFYRLVEERSQSTAYRQYLGIISLIRTDFEKISKLMMEMAAAGEGRNFANEKPPIQRIILYIDDLDRCRPERVVEVLEAVHLLLAFPLFVVVVGVDPRWLHQSLLRHYHATLGESGPGNDGVQVLPGFATPQDYLEKIFQIPYALKPVEQSGYQNLVTELLRPIEKQSQPLIQKPVATSGGQAPGVIAGSDRQPALVGETGGTTGQNGEAGQPPADGEKKEDHQAEVTPAVPAGEPVFEPLIPGQLSFTKAEEDDILVLWPLFRTPRTIKRYINLYRLLRASLRTQKEVIQFQGEANRPGDYRVAMLILAVVTSFPNQAARFLVELDAWIQEVNQQPDLKPCWPDFLHAQRIKHAETASRKSTSDADNLSGIGEPGQVNDTITEEVQGEMSWERLLDALEQVCAVKNFDPTSIDALRRWAVRVSRYSFSIG